MVQRFMGAKVTDLTPAQAHKSLEAQIHELFSVCHTNGFEALLGGLKMQQVHFLCTGRPCSGSAVVDGAVAARDLPYAPTGIHDSYHAYALFSDSWMNH